MMIPPVFIIESKFPLLLFKVQPFLDQWLIHLYTVIQHLLCHILYNPVSLMGILPIQREWYLMTVYHIALSICLAEGYMITIDIYSYNTISDFKHTVTIVDIQFNCCIDDEVFSLIYKRIADCLPLCCMG